MTGTKRSDWARVWIPALLALIAFLPFLRGVLLGRSLYFRDLSQQFFPLRRFTIDGLLSGEVRYWNPYVHEGELNALPPISYPLDLFQLLVPDEWGFTLLLSLHVSLAALALRMLARSLHLSETASAGGALVYALGGFCLSSLNLYVYVQAIAWAPFVVLALMRAAEGGRRSVAVAAMAIGIAVSTTGIEIVVQSVLLAFVMVGAPFRAGRWSRVLAGVAMGIALSAPTVLAARDAIAGSARAAGFTASVVLAHSVHPLTFAQVLIASFHGDMSDFTRRFWGQNFFPRGFPYVESLYMGATVVSLALVGARFGGRFRRRLVVAALVALVICLGRWGGLEPLAEALPALRKLRYPVKAFFTFHFVVALLAAFGLQALGKASTPAWRCLAGVGLLLAGVLAILPAAPHVLPGAFRWFVAGFFPFDEPWPMRLQDMALLLGDARVGGVMLGAAAGIALLVLRGSLGGRTAGILVVATVATDLLRAGAGLNPMVTLSFFTVSSETSRVVASLDDARVFSCMPTDAAAYLRARAPMALGRIDHETWTFATMIETLTQYSNVRISVRSAYGIDATMLVPVERVFSPREASCQQIDPIMGRLRRAGVSRVLSVDPLDHPDLDLQEVVRPERIAPLSIHVYRLAGALPLRFVASAVKTAPDPGAAEKAILETPAFLATGGTVIQDEGPEVEAVSGRIESVREWPGHIEMDVLADRPAAVVVREAYAPGWRAWIDGRPAPVLRADGRHQAVRVPEGRSHLRLRYRPEHLTLGLILGGTALVVVMALARPYAPKRGSDRHPETAA